MRWLPKRRVVLGFFVGLSVLTVLGIITCTQFVLARLIAIGIEVPFSMRLSTTLQDVAGMLPLFGGIFGTGFLVAMLVAALIARWVKILPELVHALAGFAAVAVTLLSLKMAFEITAIAAARDVTGFIALCLVGALAGYLHQQIAGGKMRRAAAPVASQNDGPNDPSDM